MIFHYFKRFLLLFNVDEHLAALFVELARGASGLGHLRFFCLQRTICLKISTVTQA